MVCLALQQPVRDVRKQVRRLPEDCQVGFGGVSALQVYKAIIAASIASPSQAATIRVAVVLVSIDKCASGVDSLVASVCARHCKCRKTRHETFTIVAIMHLNA
jgi:hypothetical protein